MWKPESFILGSASILGLAGLLALVPVEARACGGTFCDGNLPTSMPVDQTGETILFAIDNGYVEAHIQIEYDGGDANEFAWLVPVPSVPELEIGSWRLVQSVLDATRPVYGYQNSFQCDDPSADDGADTGAVFLVRPDGGGAAPDPTVLAQDVVGAFEYAILQGGTAQTVTQWLQANDYAVTDEAPAILDEYIAEGHVFVALRLRHNQGVTDIHPIVIRFAGDEPCIPIRLTRVAAKEDMDIRALFLGEARVVPTTYRHVLLNRTRLDWLALGANYRELVTMAVDAPMSDGRGFVTEYAGASDVVSTFALDTSSFVPSVFLTTPVVDVIDVLEGQGVLRCEDTGCEWYHELAASLVHEFLPVPDGIAEADFYTCLSCFAALIDAEAWDPEAFAAAYTERIVAPLQHGQELLATWPYVTRLYTTISPHEMTVDPMFAENAELPDVANRSGAQLEQHCCGSAMQLPGGREVWLESTASWPAWSEEMPWAERIEEFSDRGGAPIVLVDESALVDEQLAQWNAAIACSNPDGGTGTGGVGDTGIGSTGLGTSGGVGPEDDGTAGGGSGLDAAPVEGCACATTDPLGRGAAWHAVLLGLGVLGLRRRRSA